MSNSSCEIVYPISSRSTAGCTPHGRYENNETHTMRTILDNPFLRYLAVTLLCFSLVMVTGCSGCSDKEDSKAAKKEKDKKKKKKKKKDYESRRAVILPGYYPKPKTEEEIEAELREQIAELRLKAREKLISNLEPAQQTQAKELLGEEFDFSSLSRGEKQDRKKAWKK